MGLQLESEAAVPSVSLSSHLLFVSFEEPVSIFGNKILNINLNTHNFGFRGCL